jgi:hypothetical protein
MKHFSACSKEDTMDTNSSPDKNLPSRRVSLPTFARRIFRLLRMFWLVELILLLVALYGLYVGWSTPRQWSDGYFFAAAAQFLIAGISVVGGPAQTDTDAAYVRYVVDGDISETRNQLFMDFLHKMNFGVRALIGGLLTLLISGFFLLV